MRILQINVTANWGSTGHIAEEIGRVVQEKGWESYMAGILSQVLLICYM